MVRLKNDRILGLKDVITQGSSEVRRLHKVIADMQEDFKVRDQVYALKIDELTAQKLALEEKAAADEIDEKDIKEALTELAEYEEIIRRGNGRTIADVKKEVAVLLKRLDQYKEQHATSSWEFDDAVTRLKRFRRMYKSTFAEKPLLERACNEYERIPTRRLAITEQGEGASSSAAVPTSRGGLCNIGKRGQPATAPRRPRSSKRAATVGMGRGNQFLDNIMNCSFVEKYLYCSKPKSENPDE